MDNTQQQYPCMQMTIEQWKFARPYLKMWKYEIVGFNINCLIDKTQSLIVLNYTKFGVITNLSIDRAQTPSRYLVEDLDIFLAQAAELKGYEYTKPIKKCDKQNFKSTSEPNTSSSISDIIIDNEDFSFEKRKKNDKYF